MIYLGSTVAGLQSLRWLLPMVVAIGACGEDDNVRDANKPPTFTQSCEVGAHDCADPFECLEVPERPGPMCTLSCSKDDECPAWQATGHCAGFAQSRCSGGVCQYACK